MHALATDQSGIRDERRYGEVSPRVFRHVIQPIVLYSFGSSSSAIYSSPPESELLFVPGYNFWGKWIMAIRTDSPLIHCAPQTAEIRSRLAAPSRSDESDENDAI